MWESLETESKYYNKIWNQLFLVADIDCTFLHQISVIKKSLCRVKLIVGWRLCKSYTLIQIRIWIVASGSFILQGLMQLKCNLLILYIFQVFIVCYW